MSLDLQGKRFAVIGMARSGIGAAKLIHRLGGRALISDIKPASELTSAIEELREFDVEVECGSHARAASESFEAVVLSPGVVPPTELVQSWSGRAIPVWSELELASRSYDGRWIGVTGSNGKTTTVHLLAGILRETGLDVAMAGNVGTAWSGLLPAPPGRVFVVEVSSFQLEYSPTVRPRVALLLNLFENHLDRHGTMEVYAELKSRLMRNQQADDVAVLNGDDARVRHLSRGLRARIVYFGSGEPCDFRAGPEGITCHVHGCGEMLVPRGELPLIGRHNELNAAAAAAAAYAFGADAASIRRGLQAARPVEHRIEFVVSENGVDYFNDSKSTNMVATMTALDAFADNVILLFGGRPKKESFAPLAERIPHPVKAIIVFGEAVPKLREELRSRLPVREVRDLAEAVSLARHLSKPGDTVLLSPGCTSFDQFKNFEERGTTFKVMVKGA